MKKIHENISEPGNKQMYCAMLLSRVNIKEEQVFIVYLPSTFNISCKFLSREAFFASVPEAS